MKSRNVHNLLPENPNHDLIDRIDDLLRTTRGQVGLIVDLALENESVELKGSHLVEVMVSVDELLQQIEAAANELYREKTVA